MPLKETAMATGGHFEQHNIWDLGEEVQVVVDVSLHTERVVVGVQAEDGDGDPVGDQDRIGVPKELGVVPAWAGEGGTCDEQLVHIASIADSHARRSVCSAE